MSLRPSLDDVLSAYAVEPDTGRETLERYLRRFPEYALQLLDLSRELARALPDNDVPLSETEEAAIAASWTAYSAGLAEPTDVFADLKPAQLSQVASALTIPRQVLTAIRERRVTFSTYPRRFLRRLAEALGRALDEVVATLSLPKAVGERSFKSDDKPVTTIETVPFDQILRQAGVSGDNLADLLADDD